MTMLTRCTGIVIAIACFTACHGCPLFCPQAAFVAVKVDLHKVVTAAVAQHGAACANVKDWGGHFLTFLNKL